ncbi:uncharacterized protein LOC127835322 [Dreissena polymorpha]|uniref:Uncharacterized protein n=1 Tax=Dreissena polymorpha TaxID=45954 RepID=A0A9D4MWG0_DREPO|nr:uncharacterized protein LOC127835322 [Dreissena polymorpha]XP_052217656.1 uncharacterized protein LOC127835322 [Dreissena polymorpha]XP_052217659.1 uncharacterized protein LOC127835322 [Dreissena polymorpha]KAH3883806.1 hypothetical protein DPMN_007774 [Dreissena polymorpha]
MKNIIIISTVTIIGVAVATAVAFAVFVCCKIKRKANEDHRPSISDGISESTDPLVNSKDSLHYNICDVSYQISDVSEYATPSDVPDDWPSIARSRPAAMKSEYDTLSNFKATKKSNSRVALVHAYSHVSIVPANEILENDSTIENEYDVSTLNRRPSVTILDQNAYSRMAIVPTNQKLERESNIENEYDLSTLNRRPSVSILDQNAYSHVAIVPTNQKLERDSNMENT